MLFIPVMAKLHFQDHDKYADLVLKKHLLLLSLLKTAVLRNIFGKVDAHFQDLCYVAL